MVARLISDVPVLRLGSLDAGDAIVAAAELISSLLFMLRRNNDDMARDKTDDERLAKGRGVIGVNGDCSGSVTVLAVDVNESWIEGAGELVWSSTGRKWSLPG